MSSPDTPHSATVTGGGWQVSWLPGRTLDRNQAITAMTIASTVGGRGVPRADNPIWLHLDGWAAELGLTAPAAVARAARRYKNAKPRPAKSQRPRDSAVRSPGR
jgi:hypothetical protein